jgi:hypothetical protein
MYNRTIAGAAVGEIATEGGGTVGPEEARHWYDFFLPLAERGGPILTLLLGMILLVSLWYGLRVLRECVVHNRMLNERLITQQEKFHQDLLLRLAHCPPAP